MDKVKELGVKKILVTLGVAAGVGTLVDYFFYGQVISGLNFPIYIAIILLSGFGLLRGFKMKVPKESYWFALGMMIFASFLAIRRSEVLLNVNTLMVFFLAILLLEKLLKKKIRDLMITDYIKTIIGVPLEIFQKAVNFIGEFLKLRTLIKNHKTASQVMRGILVALPVLLLFIALFASADLVFSSMLKQMFSFQIHGETVMRLFIILGTIFVLLGLFGFILLPQNIADPVSKEFKNGFIKTKFGKVESSIFLGLINVLFLLFIIIQFAYFFGAESNISFQGFTYSEYARRGFFELIQVAVISFLILMTLEKVVTKNEKKHFPVFKWLSGIFIVEIGVIMVSAFKRLMLYENAYGFTELRLYSQLFVVFLAMIFLILLVKIIRDAHEKDFAFASMVVTVISFIGLNIFNPDAFITRQNINIFPQTGKLDILYLSDLSDDAIPEMARVLDPSSPDYQKYTDEFRDEVKSVFKRRANNNIFKDWRSWNYSNQVATEIVLKSI